MAKTLTISKTLSFKNTATGFSYKTDEELKKAAWLFKIMNHSWLVNLGSKIGLGAIKMNLPFVESAMKSNIFEHFCSGTTLLNSQAAIERLGNYKVQSVLDYGAEAKTKETDFNNVMNEAIRAIYFAAKNSNISTVNVKITTLARFDLLEKIQSDESLNEAETKEYRNILKRIDSICYAAHNQGVAVFIEAEESWIQNTIDFIVRRMMRRYNKEKAIVYNTFQMYRKNSIDHLFESYDDAKKESYVLGVKLVRGAYMESERARATSLCYSSPIQETKKATDNDFNTATLFCVNNHLNISSVIATHSEESCLLQAELMLKKDIAKNHPHLNFCQFYGISDTLTFNLANTGFNAAKCMIYGPVKEVIPFLIKRVQENTTFTGDVSREYDLITREMKRRGLG